MKNYGLCRKCFHEDFLYRYAKTRAKILSILPGRNKKLWKRNYEDIFDNYYRIGDHDNSLPENHFMNLRTIITADLVHREDIKELQNGIRHLLKTRRTNRFFNFHTDGLDEICNRLEKMDSTLLSWYEKVDCGIFEFKGHRLESTIDYFTVSICNIDSAYLVLEFSLYLTDEKKNELDKLIKCNYHEDRGYATSTLTARKNRIGSFQNYSVIHYNDDALKADKIYEFISRIEWEFYEALSHYFPFALHKRGIMPPRIETYYTDIDYHEDCRAFWDSIGVAEYQGQFIDERQKVFFECKLSGRYEQTQANNRLIYIIKDDGIEAGQFKSVKDDVYFHLKDYAIEYFKILFLDILSRESGKIVVSYKHKLDKIKLRKNRLKSLLKLKYEFSLDIDDYNRYVRDDTWTQVVKKLEEIYADSDEMAKKLTKPFYISYKNFCNAAISGTKKIENDINVLLSEFEDKAHILQTLSDYKNTVRSMALNAVMLIIAAITLFFVIFPEKTTVIADFLRLIYHYFTNAFK